MKKTSRDNAKSMPLEYGNVSTEKRIERESNSEKTIPPVMIGEKDALVIPPLTGIEVLFLDVDKSGKDCTAEDTVDAHDAGRDGACG